jgi:hypothetical protein
LFAHFDPAGELVIPFAQLIAIRNHPGADISGERNLMMLQLVPQGTAHGNQPEQRSVLQLLSIESQSRFPIALLDTLRYEQLA